MIDIRLLRRPMSEFQLIFNPMTMTFPADIIGCMKDCILSILWPREEIYAFFKKHDCTKADLKVIDQFKAREISRSRMVDLVFEELSARADSGLGPFRAMLNSLVIWSHFDPYYFEKLKKLSRADADRNIQHLRQLQEIRDVVIKEDRKRRETADAERQRPKISLSDLRDSFLRLHAGQLNSQERGYALEKILNDLGRLESLEVSEPFRVFGEQIDGSIKFEGEHYLVEAKWQDQSASNEAVYQFVGKVEGKMYGRGLFVSIHGFSEHVIHSVVRGKAIKTIFVDGEDLILILEGHLSLRDTIDRKVKAAQTQGHIYVHPISCKPKVNVP